MYAINECNELLKAGVSIKVAKPNLASELRRVNKNRQF